MLGSTPYCEANRVVEVQPHAFLTLALNRGMCQCNTLATESSVIPGQNAGWVLQLTRTLLRKKKSLGPAGNEQDYRGVY
jgi:hypothetical protein